MTEYKKSTRKIIELGESLLITIPRDFIRAHGLKKGDLVDVFFDDKLVVKPIKAEDIRKEIYGERGKK